MFKETFILQSIYNCGTVQSFALCLYIVNSAAGILLFVSLLSWFVSLWTLRRSQFEGQIN